MIAHCKASNCPSARAQDETAARRNAERACSAAIDKAARAAEDSKAQACPLAELTPTWTLYSRTAELPPGP